MSSSDWLFANLLKWTPPSTITLKELVGAKPTLIMIDEFAYYLRVVWEKMGKIDLVDKASAFLLPLLELAATSKQVVVVYTLAESKDAFGKETEAIQIALGDAKAISARQERVLTPTSETEISAIVTHRLFQVVDRDAGRETAKHYAQYYSQLSNQNVELPIRAGKAEYALEIAENYPFHPELLNTLNRKVGTIPNFQKTRGSLRLLALAIRELWKVKPSETYLIHPHYISLAQADIANDLTSRLDRPAFKQVIEADIASALPGTSSHSQAIDEVWVKSGKPPYAGRAATTIFLHSLTHGVASGTEVADINLAVLEPGNDAQLLKKALERLVNTQHQTMLLILSMCSL